MSLSSKITLLTALTVAPVGCTPSMQSRPMESPCSTVPKQTRSDVEQALLRRLGASYEGDQEDKSTIVCSGPLPSMGAVTANEYIAKEQIGKKACGSEYVGTPNIHNLSKKVVTGEYNGQSFSCSQITHGKVDCQ